MKSTLKHQTLARNITTHDITHDFRRSVRCIAPGTLVKDEFLSLFEAVGALEIGDPKMDSGSLRPGEDLMEDFDTTIPLLPEEVIWIMDQMLALQVAWLNGYPLSQTLFTSVHIDRLLWPDPKHLDEANFDRTSNNHEHRSSRNLILRLFCLLLVKTCDMILQTVTSQHYYEEEDLTTQLFHRELLRRFGADDVLAYVRDLASELDQRDATGAVQGITVRLEFQMSLCQFLRECVQDRPRNAASAPVSDMHARLSTMKHTAKHGRPVPDSFSTKIQRRLASTMPPRPQVIVETESVWPFWRTFLQDCQHTWALTRAKSSPGLLEMYHVFAVQSPQLTVYPRARIQRFVNIGGQVLGTIDPDEFILHDVQTLTWPAWVKLNRTPAELAISPSVRFGMQEFLQLFRDTFLNLFRALSLNSCRIRRNLCHAVLEWDHLQGEVEQIDSNLQRVLHEQPLMIEGVETYAFVLSSWVYHHKLSMMRIIVQLGFEQEIYAPYELAGMYYYLSRLCDTHLAHLERISHFIVEEKTRPVTPHSGTDGRDPGQDIYSTTLSRLYHEYAIVKATSCLAQALHRTFLVLQRFGAYKSPTPAHSSEELRYEIRMKPFGSLSVPELQPLHDFRAAVELESASTRTLLEDALESSSLALVTWQEVLQRGRIGPRKNNLDATLTFIDDSWREDVEKAIKVTTTTVEHCQLLLSACDDRTQQESLVKHARVSRVDSAEQLHRRWTLPVLMF